MYKGFCHTCQKSAETSNGFCEICNDLVEITEDYSTQSLNTAVSLSEPFSQNIENKTFISPTQQTQVNNQNYTPQPNGDTTGNNDYYVNRRTGFGGNIHAKPNTTFSNPAIEGSEGYSILTLGIIGLFLFLGLGYGISYAKAYFASMPDKIATEATEARNNPEFQKRASEFLGNLQSGANPAATVAVTAQKPWFSSWFKSNPTAEEIFEKYESETVVNGKSLNATSMFFSGKLSISSIKPKGSTVSNNVAVTSDFEMSMKAPNKVFMKMEMRTNVPTQSNNGYTQYSDFSQPMQTVKAGVTAGFDGTNRWSITKVLIGGGIKTQETNDANEGSIDKALNNPDAFVFNRQKYQSIEFSGTEAIGSKKSYIIKATKDSGEIDLLYFDIETGLINYYVSKDYKMLISTYGRFEGYKTPSVFQIETPEMTFQMDIFQLKPDVPFDDSIFLRSSYK
jgi:hypothetical protein